jgi:hypothetical protein
VKKTHEHLQTYQQVIQHFREFKMDSSFFPKLSNPVRATKEEEEEEAAMLILGAPHRALGGGQKESPLLLWLDWL